MILALDSSVLLAIFKDEPGAEAWLDALIRARHVGRLVLCEIVYAEIAPAFQTRAELDAALAKLGAGTDPIRDDAAWMAGQVFLSYRRNGGPREHMIPDFLIAAHARLQASQLAAVDRGYFRRFFPDLPVMRRSPGG